nr:MAG TPA: Mis18 Yippee zinc-binding/DNA-binding /Mis18, centromere assembly [Bacteriophage sp.]
MFTHQEINCSCTNILGTMYLHTYQRCLNKIFLHYI